MPPYDAQRFQPPAAVATVAVRNPQTRQSVSDVELLIDSGADLTLIPAAALRSVAIAADAGQCELAGFDGTRSFANTALLDMTFLGKTFRGKYVVIADNIGVLGRDVLNHFVIVLDGPGNEWRQGSQL